MVEFTRQDWLDNIAETERVLRNSTMAVLIFENELKFAKEQLKKFPDDKQKKLDRPAGVG